MTRPVPSPDPPGWLDGAPTSGIGQSCAFCGTRDVAWIHRLSPELVGYRVYGKGHTLPTFWTLCDGCEQLYESGDDEAAVQVMRSSWLPVADEDVTECIRQPLAVFRRADLGSRRLDPEPVGVAEARRHGFVPLREVTGAGGRLGPLWPPEHRRWIDELDRSPGVDEDETMPLDRWLVRSPWPSLSVDEALAVLWRWAERDSAGREGDVWRARVVEALGWSESAALAFTDPEP